MPLTLATFNVKDLLPPREEAERNVLAAKLGIAGTAAFDMEIACTNARTIVSQRV